MTEYALQRRYPPAPGAFSTHYTSGDLCDDAFVSAPRRPRATAGRFHLVSVGTMAELYKAQDVLIDAVGICLRAGRDVRLVLVGDGRRRQELETRARPLG